tara:strand:+ start:45935 stop:46546 length:612 start_codon:yes stop_codon:yes gene_type:complete
MSIELNNISSGYSTGLINDNFQAIEEYINNNLLNRTGLVSGEANQMEAPLDMNSNPILNIGFDINNPDSIITISDADARYVNVSGDAMTGPLTIERATESTQAVRKDQLDEETLARQTADSNLQQQLTGTIPLESSAFSPISWHSQEVGNSVVIPDGVNAWSFGPNMSIAAGQSVTVGQGSFWTIAEGQAFTGEITSYDEGYL